MTVIDATEHRHAAQLLGRIAAIFDQRVVGQRPLYASLVAALIAGGHVLLESVPGLAKTTGAQTLAAAVSGTFRRIQCTPDLMPNDIVGTQVFNNATGAFTTILGPVHANLVLLDEINRSSAKTQAAMLEAMQERQTTIGGELYPLPAPFMVVATQNPIEEEGTYILPEAQMDRFLLKEVLAYPDRAEEAEILERLTGGAFDAPLRGEPVSLADVSHLQALVQRVYVAPDLKRYVVEIANATRLAGVAVPQLAGNVRLGASPRGSIALIRLGQAIALMAGRDYVTPDDVKAVRHPALRHRILRSYDAAANNVPVEWLIDAVFAAVPTP
ncbi:MAG: MoxR family ATPase [Bifidobacteriaceae bacterium]|jgi:MoxR-like ATPase|nr:MoxR family ATPase [Bifidobacteriaceae bacterium]